ncbi:MAG: leucine-rich repeat protein [Oscillospiraceae bacterium]|nr:leucine-rich repeat protein [Oscillospiraceae bacterium]
MKLRKFLAVTSAFCMMWAVMPVLPIQENSSILADAEESGTCGTNLKWVLDEEGTLTISGTGKMKDWKSSDYVPWYANRADIKNVIIENGVTSIGKYAFIHCKNLISVTIPDTVTAIQTGAFWYCESLISAELPDSLLSIADYAFNTCESLTSAEIPDSVTSIGQAVFAHCISLTSATLPNGLTSIENSLFYDCTGLVSVTIPDSVTNIKFSAFCGCHELTSANIPDSVLNIGTEAFRSCSSLRSVKIPEGVTVIQSGTFADCTALTSAEIPASVTSIEEEAFSCCSALDTVIIQNPDCEIFDAKNTFSNTYDSRIEFYSFNGTIYGYEGSTAQAYAEKYERNFAFISSAPETSESEAILLGDVSGDGEINILDVITINKAILGKEELTEAQIKAIDFNGNGKPDSEESLTLMKYIVKLITSLTK